MRKREAVFLTGVLVLTSLCSCSKPKDSLLPTILYETTRTEISEYTTEHTTEQITEYITDDFVESETAIDEEASVSEIVSPDAFFTVLKDLYEKDKQRYRGNLDLNADTMRIILTNSNLSNRQVTGYGAEYILRDENDNIILQFDNSENCSKALDSLTEIVGEDHIEKDQYIGLFPDESVTFATESVSNISANGVSSSSGQLSYGPEMIGSSDFIARMSDSQKSKTIIVAVIDTGVDTDHEFLKNHLVSGASFVASTYEDGNGHGTHVSGIIVDSTLGTNVKIMPVQVLDASGNGANSGVASGINWAVNHGANVINLSLGGYDYGNSHYLDSAVNNAISKGVTVVAAAGNDGAATTYFCPAHIENAITVGAVDSSYNRAYFSNYGSSLDLSAPGVDIYSTVIGGYGTMSGTSMATPFVSAVAALVLEAGVAGNPSSVNSVLRQYSVDCGTLGWDQYYGAGVINLSDIKLDNDKIETTEATETTEADISTRETTSFIETIPETEEWFTWPIYWTTEAPTQITTQPTTTQPTTTQPIMTQPTTTQPITTQPITTQPAITQPTTSESTIPESTTVNPTTVKPTTAKPTETHTETEATSEETTIAETETQTEATTEEPTQPQPTYTQPTHSYPNSGNYGTSISVSTNSSYTNGKMTVKLTLKTDADVSLLTILVDGRDYHSYLEYDGNNTYHITFSTGGHSFYIASPNGYISSSGSF